MPHRSDSYAAKKARAERLGYPSVRAMREATPKKGIPLTAAQCARKHAALKVPARARREGISLAAAAKREGVSMAAVKQWVPSAIEKRGGRLVPKPSDRLPRAMEAFTTEGFQTVLVRSSRKASLIGRHRVAVGKYLDGDAAALRRVQRDVRGQTFNGYELEFDPGRILEMERQGAFKEISTEGIYRTVTVAA